ncbi:MAG TPA: hypothetical protein VFZ34_06430 [Blastocatellia bacterium]|nr:hypothetical protein [Blastocatellia bacterium]
MIRLLTLLCLCTLTFSAHSFAKTPRAKAAKKLASVTSTPFVQRDEMEYLLLATKKTSSMQKEMNEAGTEGYRFEGTMGGETSVGGNEAVVIMGRPKSGKTTASYQYKLLATSKTSTMQKEMNQAAAAGFVYKGQTVFESTFGGKEVVVIMEMGGETKEEYQLLATTKTSTMQKEMNQLATQGYFFCGITVAETAFGGKELVVIMRRPR